MNWLRSKNLMCWLRWWTLILVLRRRLSLGCGCGWVEASGGTTLWCSSLGWTSRDWLTHRRNWCSIWWHSFLLVHVTWHWPLALEALCTLSWWLVHWRLWLRLSLLWLINLGLGFSLIVVAIIGIQADIALVLESRWQNSSTCL